MYKLRIYLLICVLEIESVNKYFNNQLIRKSLFVLLKFNLSVETTFKSVFKKQVYA
jgi:hypothetical protein